MGESPTREGPGYAAGKKRNWRRFVFILDIVILSCIAIFLHPYYISLSSALVQVLPCAGDVNYHKREITKKKKTKNVKQNLKLTMINLSNAVKKKMLYFGVYF